MAFASKKKGRQRSGGKAKPTKSEQQVEVDTSQAEKDPEMTTPLTSPDSECTKKENTFDDNIDTDQNQVENQEECEVPSPENANDIAAVATEDAEEGVDVHEGTLEQDEPDLVVEEAALNEIPANKTETLEPLQTEREKENIKPPTENVIVPSSKASQSVISNQQALMIESGKLLEHLRREIYKLRSQNSQLRSDFESLQGNNQRLMDANTSLGSTFENLNNHAKQMSKANAKLKQELQKTKEKLQIERAESKGKIAAMSTLHMELKEELKMKQGSYIAEVHSRLNYQQVLANVVDKIQGRCRDHRLVEEILAMSEQCDM